MKERGKGVLHRLSNKCAHSLQSSTFDNAFQDNATTITSRCVQRSAIQKLALSKECVWDDMPISHWFSSHVSTLSVVLILIICHMGVHFIDQTQIQQGFVPSPTLG